MSILDRILLVILSVCAFGAAVIALMLGIGVSSPILSVLGDPASYNNVYMAVIAVVVGLIAIRFFFYRWGRGPSVDFVTLPGEHGAIRVSHETIRQLSNRTGKAVRGIQEFETRVRNGQVGILLAVRVKALPDIDLANMSNDVQEAVKTYIEKTTGITVERISVNIAELSVTAAKSSRAWVE